MTTLSDLALPRYSYVSNKRHALISVTPDKFPKIIKRNAIKMTLISVILDKFPHTYTVVWDQTFRWY